MEREKMRMPSSQPRSVSPVRMGMPASQPGLDMPTSSDGMRAAPCPPPPPAQVPEVGRSSPRMRMPSSQPRSPSPRPGMVGGDRPPQQPHPQPHPPLQPHPQPHPLALPVLPAGVPQIRICGTALLWQHVHGWGRSRMPWIWGLLESALQRTSMTLSVSATGVLCVWEQRWVNTSSAPLEAVFTATPGAAMAVCGFDIIKDGVTTSATIKATAAAKDDYDDAISAGNVGALGERHADGTFTVRLGNLQPDATLTTRVHIVAPMHADSAGRLGFAVPAALLRAGPMRELELRVETMFPGGADVGVIRNHQYVACPDGTYHSVTQNDLAHDGVFAVEVAPKKAFEPHVLIEDDGKSLAAALTFFPSWDQLDKDLLTPYVEVVFLVDRSGSMGGGFGPSRGLRLRKARETLLLFASSLPQNCKVQVVGFGDHHAELFPSGSVDYNAKTLAAIQQYAAAMEADMNGTNLLDPLKLVLSKAPLEDYPRHVFVLTDGDVSNRDATIACVNRYRGAARVYAVGLGSGADRALVEGIAGVGLSDMIGDKDDMRGAVMRLLSRALEPTLRRVRVEFSGFRAAVQVPSAPLRPVANGERLTVYGLELGGGPGTVKLTGIAPDESPYSFEMAVRGDDAAHVVKGSTVHRAAAWERVCELQEQLTKGLGDAAAIKKQIEALGLRYGLATSQTAFVASAENETFSNTAMYSVAHGEGASTKQKLQSSNIEMPLARVFAVGGHADRDKGKLGGKPIQQAGRGGGGPPSPPPPAAFQQAPMGYDYQDGSFEELALSEPTASRTAATLSPRLAAPKGRSSSFSEEKSSVGRMSASPARPPQSVGGAPPSPSAVRPPSPLAVRPSSPTSHREERSDGTAAAAATDDVVVRVARAQDALGFWEPSSAALELVKGGAAALAKVPSTGCKDAALVKRLWATAIVLAWLATHRAAEESAWQLFAQKARTWLKKQCITAKITVDFIDLAKKAI